MAIVVPGDDPPQLQDSPHLEQLKLSGKVILHADRLPTWNPGDEFRPAREKQGVK
jgi:hypothetical protein